MCFDLQLNFGKRIKKILNPRYGTIWRMLICYIENAYQFEYIQQIRKTFLVAQFDHNQLFVGILY